MAKSTINTADNIFNLEILTKKKTKPETVNIYTMERKKFHISYSYSILL